MNFCVKWCLQLTGKNNKFTFFFVIVNGIFGAVRFFVIQLKIIRILEKPFISLFTVNLSRPFLESYLFSFELNLRFFLPKFTFLSWCIKFLLIFLSNLLVCFFCFWLNDLLSFHTVQSTHFT